MGTITRSISGFVAATTLAGLAMVACGGDDGSGGNDDKSKPPVSGKKDAGKNAAKDAGSRAATVEPGDSCSGKRPGTCSEESCESPPCVAPCEDGEYGECVSEEDLEDEQDAAAPSPGNLLPDGSSIGISEAGATVMFGEASVPIPATQCPDGLTCSNIGAAIGIPISYCSDNGFTPPPCTSMADCTALGFKLATCGMSPIGGMACLQVCK